MPECANVCGSRPAWRDPNPVFFIYATSVYLKGHVTACVGLRFPKSRKSPEQILMTFSVNVENGPRTRRVVLVVLPVTFTINMEKKALSSSSSSSSG